ncbi:MAG TPA: cupin domain-containing protein [Vicinamibacterales bacterium]|nr:cupin domain-containing protein [Vicinamibacterales bacterium]
MIMNRREAAAAFAMFAAAIEGLGAREASDGAGAPQAPQAPNVVFKHDLPAVNLDGWEVTVSHVDMPPGRVGAAHQHAGFVLAYVVSGKVITKVSGQGPEHVVNAGEMFYEQPGATHEVSKNASQTEPARLLALIFAPKGATLTKPASR